jgi:hypothetical protein
MGVKFFLSEITLLYVYIDTFLQLAIMKFHENLFSNFRVLTYVQTEEQEDGEIYYVLRMNEEKSKKDDF